MGLKHRLRGEFPELYSQDLLNILFRHPYTRIGFLVSELGVTRQTTEKYLDALAEADPVSKQRACKHNYYVAGTPVQLFLDVAGRVENGYPPR